MKEVSNHKDFYTYTIHDYSVSLLNEIFIQKLSSEGFYPEKKSELDVYQEKIEIDSVLFYEPSQNNGEIFNWIIQQNNNILLSCSCNAVSNNLCNHQSQALYRLLKRDELRIFFDRNLRIEKFRKFAEPYGLKHSPNIEAFFLLEYQNQKTVIKPASSSLLPVSKDLTSNLKDQLFAGSNSISLKKEKSKDTQIIVVFKQHKYYRHLIIELFEAAITQTGKLKNPLRQLNPVEYIWNTEKDSESKFFSGISLFQRSLSEQTSSAIEGLKAILKNPLKLKFYVHDPELSENIVAGSIQLLRVAENLYDLRISVIQKDDFYEVFGEIILDNNVFGLENLPFKSDYFLEIEGILHLIGNNTLLKTIEFLKQYNNKLLIHESKYPEFREHVLENIENIASVNYTYLKPATPKQLEENKFNEPPQKIIYLTDSDPFVELEPVFKYGDIEIPILSKKQIYPKGIKSTFSVKRDTEAEIQFTAQIIKQHDFFKEQQEDGLPYFYLHKERFLNEDWFLNAFEEWQNQGITILGFNKLKENKLNPDKVKIRVKVLSGIDWFNAEIEVSYGKRKASLLQLNKAIHNKSRYIQLDDGTLGILPKAWIEKFTEYFNSGEIKEDTLNIPKTNYSTIEQLFEEEEIDISTKAEISRIKQKFAGLEIINQVDVPAELNATLRDYQKHGLSWLNLLDDLNFGGCLADDMGLGKSIQIIAFILLQRKKRKHNTNLLVVPTSLIFNWKEEVQKFAPDIKIYTLYGANRVVHAKEFNDFEIILTSYGTLLSDVNFLKNYEFNYVFLDESQNIKNPESQRHKAARLLKSRNKIVITGTPVENNTFDLFGQLSFACPGLLGSKQYFKDIYSSPIDKFKDSKRATELQQKIKPFILRRTKKQVAAELPDKTEMVLFCEMGIEQRKIYDAFEKEFREFICSKTQEEIPKSSIHVLRGLTRLRQICNSPLLLNDEEIIESASSKIDTLLEQIQIKSPHHKILIFSQFVSMLDLIKSELEKNEIDYSYLTGSTRNREVVVNEFQNDVSKRVFLISLKAGGTGLNLTQADYVYLIDPWWNPAVENQAIDRVYRIGQKKNVVAVRLICQDTIEEKIMKLQEFKKGLANELINTDESIAKSLTKEGLLDLLGRD